MTAPPGPVHCLTPSTQTNIFVTAAADSLVAATIDTGEVTVAFRAGVQIVTDGSALPGVHGVGELVLTVTKIVCLAITPATSIV